MLVIMMARATAAARITVLTTTMGMDTVMVTGMDTGVGDNKQVYCLRIRSRVIPAP